MRVAFKKRLVRSRLLEFMSKLAPCLVGLEALQQRALLGAQDRAAREALHSSSRNDYLT